MRKDLETFNLVLQPSGEGGVFGECESKHFPVNHSYPKCIEGRIVYGIVEVGENDKNEIIYITDKYDMRRIIGLNIDLQNLGGVDPDDLYVFGTILRRYNEDVGCGFVLFAADQGSIDACLDIGINQYEHGHSDQDALILGKKYLQKAAAKGSACGKCWLGSYYAEGKGCKKNKNLAKRWFSEAAAECEYAEGYLEHYGLK